MERILSLTAMVGILATMTIGCASGGQTKGSETADEVVGSPPASEQPADVSAGREVSPEVIAEETSDEDQPSDEPPEQAEPKAKPSNTEQQSVDRQALLRLFERGPAWLLQQVELTPVRQEGEFRGYRISGATAAARSQMSPQIQIGDVVTRVNGVELERPDDYLEAWSQLPRRREVSVIYTRDGESRRASWRVIRESDDG